MKPRRSEPSGKIDALACVLPDADVRGEDRLAADLGNLSHTECGRRNTSSAPSPQEPATGEAQWALGGPVTGTKARAN